MRDDCLTATGKILIDVVAHDRLMPGEIQGVTAARP